MVLARFLPQDERFFDYFHKAVENPAEVAQALRDLLDNYSDVERKARRVRDLEHRGDEITHQVFDALNRTFVTPLDREDIADLASRLDDFVDTIEQAARLVWLYRLDEPPELARLLARIIDDQAKPSPVRCHTWNISGSGITCSTVRSTSNGSRTRPMMCLTRHLWSSSTA